MESHPQNPEFRNNPENFHPCYSKFMSSIFPVWQIMSQFSQNHDVFIWFYLKDKTSTSKCPKVLNNSRLHLMFHLLIKYIVGYIAINKHQDWTKIRLLPLNQSVQSSLCLLS